MSKTQAEELYSVVMNRNFIVKSWYQEAFYSAVIVVKI